jgi:hypothetical protein
MAPIPARLVEQFPPRPLLYAGAIPLNTSLQASARIRYVDGAIVRWSPITTAKFKYNLSRCTSPR